MPSNTGSVTAKTNLATVTPADREKFVTMTRAIETLTDQLKAKDIWANSQEAEVRCLQMCDSGCSVTFTAT
jgi:predicted metal-binding protein